MSQTQPAHPATIVGAATIQLTQPITTAAGTKVQAITMRRAKVKDLRRMNDFGTSDAAQEIGMMAHLSGMPAEDFDELDAADYRKLQDTFRGFLGINAA